jgi:predicted nucleotide-binding protein (sugar kinase/HSP70/actin superfamily)
MAKTRGLEEDKKILKKKVQERQSKSENPEGDEAIRSLRKRLKRVQRKFRSFAVKNQKATPKQAGAEA